MKRKLQRASRSSLTTDLKRNKALLLTLGALVLLAPSVSSLTISGSYTRTGDDLRISARIEAAPLGEVMSALDEGMRSEIVFDLRVYRPRKGLAALFGDELVREARIVHEGRWNPFTSRYELRRNGQLESYESLASFLRALVSLRFVELSLDSSQQVRVLIQSRIAATRLVDELGILSVFLPDEFENTGWTELSDARRTL